MTKLPAAVAAALACVFSPAVLAQAQQEEMEIVLVTGEQPGPGLWKVSRDGRVMWVLGSIGAVPDTIKWRTKEIESRIAESQEVLYPGWSSVDLDISAFEFLTLVPSAFKAAKNPDGALLKDVLSPEDYATWLRLKQKYLGRDDDLEKYRPMVAEGTLEGAIEKRARKGLKLKSVDSVIHKLAKKHKVRINELPWVTRKIEVEKPRSLFKAARKLDLAEGECVGRNLRRIEKADALGLLTFDVATTNAWATGDQEALQSKAAPDPELQREDCSKAAIDAVMAAAEQSGEIARGLSLLKQQEEMSKVAAAEAELNWQEAVDAAMAKNTSTFAVLPIHLVTNQYVYVGKLKARGYVVEGPHELGSTTENAGQGPASVK